MSKTQAQELYTAYAELESAAEAFYRAADRMGQLVPSLRSAMEEACEDLNFAVVQADTELDEVV